MSWQPIETAPKDGSHILIIDATAKTPEADKVHWGRVMGKDYWRCGDSSDWEEDPRAAREILGAYETPTHWMPLPAPPGEGA